MKMKHISELDEGLNPAIKGLIDSMISGKIQRKTIRVKDEVGFNRFLKDAEPAIKSGELIVKQNPIDPSEVWISLGPKSQEKIHEKMKHIKLFEEFVNEELTQLNEYETRSFKPANPSSKDKSGAEKWLKKYMIRTAKTTEEATERIESFAGGVMFTHVQYHIVKPNGNKPDRPTFRLHQSQEWLNDANLQGREEVNATFLSIYQLKEGEEWNTSQGDAWEKVGQIYVDTKAFLNELGIVFQTIKRA